MAKTNQFFWKSTKAKTSKNNPPSKSPTSAELRTATINKISKGIGTKRAEATILARDFSNRMGFPLLRCWCISHQTFRNFLPESLK